ncbi:MAG: ATP-binding protein [Myxococcota bacterium]
MASTALPSSIQALLDALPNQAAVVDVTGVIRLTNRLWHDVYRRHGLNTDDVGKNYLAICDAASAESAEAREAGAALREVLEGEAEARRIEYPCHSPTAPHWFQLTITPIQDAARTVGALLIHTEITAEVENDLDLQAFVGHVAHDLRTPIRHLTSYAELLENEVAPTLKGRQQGWFNTVKTAAVHMRNQLDNLVALSRASVEPLVLQAIGLGEVTARRHAQLCAVLGVEATLDTTQAGTVVTDEKLFVVLIDNVIANSLRHGRAVDKPQVRVSSRTASEGFRITFEDNGPGFDGDPMQLLRPFDRGPRHIAGFGLGLSIVKQVVMRLGGELLLGESPSGGASVRITLPPPPAIP